MRKTILILGALGALTMLPACADSYYGASAGAGGVYYDGFYGPYTDGYWGPDAAFYYRGADGRFIQGDASHFRHERFGGARSYRARPYDRDRDGR